MVGMASTRAMSCGVLGMAEGGVAEERADGGQARVAGADAVAAFLLEVVQERR